MVSPDPMDTGRVDSHIDSHVDSHGDGLLESDVLESPYLQVQAWVDGALAAAEARGDGSEPLALSVATVDAANRVYIRQVTIARDLGSAIQLDGVTRADRIIDSPPDGIGDGDTVRVAKAG